jgi:hypothetical protein
LIWFDWLVKWLDWECAWISSLTNCKHFCLVEQLLVHDYD